MPYFYNTQTQQSLWDRPPELTEEQIMNLPGASEHLGGSDRPAQVRASHLLVKHSGSRRPSSWKEVRLSSYPLYLILPCPALPCPVISISIILSPLALLATLLNRVSCAHHTAEHHALERRGYHHPARIRVADQRLAEHVLRARVRTL